MILFTLSASVVNLLVSSAVYAKNRNFQLAFNSQKSAESSIATLVFFNAIFLVFINFSENSHLYAMIISACFLFSLCYAGRVFISQDKSESAFCIASILASILFLVITILKAIAIIESIPS